MTDTATRGGASSDVQRWFYAWMALSCLAVAVVGFLPTYFLPMAQGKFSAPLIVHIHGWIFFSWVTLFCVQTWFVASGKTLAHRTWGLLGISVATAMVLMTLVVVIEEMNRFDAGGFGPEKRAFAWVQVSGMLFFGTVFALAIINLKKLEVHKRLMLLATVSLLDAPIARWFAIFLAPPPPAVGLAPPPPAVLALPPGLIGDLLLVAAIVFDWRTRGKPHPVYLIGGAVLLVVQVTRMWISATPVWLSFAEWLQHIAG